MPTRFGRRPEAGAPRSNLSTCRTWRARRQHRPGWLRTGCGCWHFAVNLFSVAVVAAVAALLGKLVGLGGVGMFGVVLALAFVTELGASAWLTGGQTSGKAVCSLTVRRIDGAAPARTLGSLVWAVGRHSVGYLMVDVLGLGPCRTGNSAKAVPGLRLRHRSCRHLD
jgi:hypothetical protein